MFLKKNNENLRTLFSIFTMLALAVTILWLGANTNTTKAQSASGNETDEPLATFAGTGVGAIPDSPATGTYGTPLVISFNVTGITANVTNVSLDFTLTHTWIGDLDVVLTSPGGARSLVIFSRVGATTDAGNGDSSNLGGTYSFSDTATANIWTVATDAACGQDCIVTPGGYRTTAAGGAGQTNPAAFTSLNATFSGLTPAQANGTWTLTFRDRGNGDTGTVTAANLTVDGSAGGTVRRVPFDFTGDGRTDWATISTAAAAGSVLRWKVTGNPAPAAPNAAFIRAFDYGFNTDYIVAADYIGDRKTDVVVWRPGTPGIFYVAQFPIGTAGITLDRVVRFGDATDDAVEGGDYDGDGKADYTIVRTNADNTLTWFIKNSTTGAERAVNFGTLAGVSDFVFYPGADFTGDGRDELVFAVADPNNSNAVVYYVGDAVTGAGVLTRQFGDFDSDYSLAPADYTGDGRADFVAVRQTSGQQTWYINNSATNASTAIGFGIPDTTGARGDIQVRGDYDGDGRHDIAVYRRSNQMFYYLRSSSNNTVVDGQKHGDPGDFPLAGIAVF